MSKQKTTAKIISQTRISDGIYDMRLETALAGGALPGQFIGVYTRDKSMLLPRPISICEADRDRNMLRIVYRVVGEGTAEFSSYREGESVEILGILGNGFPVSEGKGRTAFLVSGGIGVPPMVQLSKELEPVAGRLYNVTGYRNSDIFLKDDLSKYGEVCIATEDGSFGTKGNVIDAMRALNDRGTEADVIFACGPMPMLKAVKRYAEEKHIKAYISLEERMACGVGACLGCVVRTNGTDTHSHVNNARICTDGPVFDAEYVNI